jgi:inner membrane protein involved in colicin E2 resistance
MQSSIADFAINALRETSEETIAWRTMSHYYTRDEMIAEIEARTEVGKIYVTNVLRVSRDIIARFAGEPLPDDELDGAPSMKA